MLSILFNESVTSLLVKILVASIMAIYLNCSMIAVRFFHPSMISGIVTSPNSLNPSCNGPKSVILAKPMALPRVSIAMLISANGLSNSSAPLLNILSVVKPPKNTPNIDIADIVSCLPDLLSFSLAQLSLNITPDCLLKLLLRATFPRLSNPPSIRKSLMAMRIFCIPVRFSQALILPKRGFGSFSSAFIMAL